MEKVLFVDDEEDILNGLKRSLHGEFEVHVAVGGEAGLVKLRDKGPFAVVVSDMRMPGMNGATFLAHVRSIQPHSTRMLLTGYSDADAAAEAINKGHIFRFLHKPCSRDDLQSSIHLGVDRYRNLLAEKSLLEETLLGSVRTFSEVLSVVNPLSFERATRMSACVKHLISMTVLDQPWQVEAAALLSQLGCLLHSPETIRAAHRGLPLAPDEEARYSTHPQAASDLLSHIPRMQGVAWMIRHQDGHTPGEAIEATTHVEAEELRLGAEMLRMAIAYDTLWLQGTPHTQAIFRIRQAVKSFPHALLEALQTMKPCENIQVPKTLSVHLLTEDMVIDEDILNVKGVLLVGSGQPLSKALLMKLREYSDAGTISRNVRVLASA